MENHAPLEAEINSRWRRRPCSWALTAAVRRWANISAKSAYSNPQFPHPVRTCTSRLYTGGTLVLVRGSLIITIYDFYLTSLFSKFASLHWSSSLYAHKDRRQAARTEWKPDNLLCTLDKLRSSQPTFLQFWEWILWATMNAAKRLKELQKRKTTFIYKITQISSSSLD